MFACWFKSYIFVFFNKWFCNVYFCRSVRNKSLLPPVLDKSYGSVFTFIAHVQFVRNMRTLPLTVPLIHGTDTIPIPWSHRSLTDSNPMMDDIIDTGVHSVCFVHMVHIGHLVVEVEIKGTFYSVTIIIYRWLVQERLNLITLAMELRLSYTSPSICRWWLHFAR